MLGACLDRAWILAHIPHQGRMCLLDEVTHWDAERIGCRSSTHGDADNPLRLHGRLGILCGIEYAAQAMAVHGALAAGATTGSGATTAAAGTATIRAPGTAAAGATTGAAAAAAPKPVAGFLAALRSITPHVSRLDDVPGDLIVTATRVAGDQASALYEFELRSTVRCLLSGRATVVLDANGRLQS